MTISNTIFIPMNRHNIYNKKYMVDIFNLKMYTTKRGIVIWKDICF